jgi:cytochrome c peroxidase
MGKEALSPSTTKFEDQPTRPLCSTNRRVSMRNFIILSSSAVLLLAALSLAGANSLTPEEELGRFLYFDENLSTPPGQSCASCHHPDAGFADPDTDLPVSQGVLPKNRFGNRNSPSAAYAAFSPDFHYDAVESLYVGGQFWDGRAANLVEQAKGPFLNPLEMNNPNKLNVIIKIRDSDYDELFEQVYGPGALDDVEAAYDQMAIAIAAFERTEELNQFSSKYDYYLDGTDTLTAQELRGLELFEAEDKGNCAACHPSQLGPSDEPPLFTDFTYDNLGVPKNLDNLFYYLPPAFNPDGENFIDYGLGGVLGLAEEMGKVKVPTLRNIAVTPPYMHNGVFQTLEEVVDFYNTRDVEPWPPPEVPDNVNTDELGDLGLTDQEVDDIVAFMMTLTDGYGQSVAKHAVAGCGNLAAHSDLAQPITLNNSPNPFNPKTVITYLVSKPGQVLLSVFDVNGARITDLVNDTREAGVYHATWNGTDDSGRPVSSGIYFYQLRSEDGAAVGKAILLK